MSNDKIIEKILEHDRRFDQVEDKLNNLRREILDGQDGMMTILKRLDQERIFTVEWIKRMENQIEEQKEKIKIHEDVLEKMKFKLQIA